MPQSAEQHRRQGFGCRPSSSSTLSRRRCAATGRPTPGAAAGGAHVPARQPRVPATDGEAVDRNQRAHWLPLRGAAGETGWEGESARGRASAPQQPPCCAPFLAARPCLLAFVIALSHAIAFHPRSARDISHPEPCSLDQITPLKVILQQATAIRAACSPTHSRATSPGSGCSSWRRRRWGRCTAHPSRRAAPRPHSGWVPRAAAGPVQLAADVAAAALPSCRGRPAESSRGDSQAHTCAWAPRSNSPCCCA